MCLMVKETQLTGNRNSWGDSNIFLYCHVASSIWKLHERWISWIFRSCPQRWRASQSLYYLCYLALGSRQCPFYYKIHVTVYTRFWRDKTQTLSFNGRSIKVPKEYVTPDIMLWQFQENAISQRCPKSFAWSWCPPKWWEEASPSQHHSVQYSLSTDVLQFLCLIRKFCVFLRTCSLLWQKPLWGLIR